MGIKFPPKQLCLTFLDHHDEIVISTHITAEMLELEENAYIYSALIDDQFGNLIDLIIDPGEYEFVGQTTIVDFTSGVPEVIREGAGNPDIFKK